MIDIQELSVDLGGNRVLENVSLQVQSGELLGLIGPNGAGKTTLLRAIAGIVDPRSGSIAIDGTDVTELDQRPLSRHMAVVPQSSEPSFGFRVRDIVAMGRTPYYGRYRQRDPDGEEVITTALARTETTHLADRQITEVSSGERQRVLLARSLAQDTPALLLDEPTANLDIKHQIRTFELVRQLTDGGKAAIAAIHDLELAARYCDRLLLLSEGRAVGSGSPEDVLSKDRVSEAFETRVAIRDDAVTGGRVVIPLPDRAPNGTRIAVIGGGGVAAPLVRTLDRAGYDLTVGIVRDGDRDGDVATALGFETVTAPARGPLSEEAIERMHRCVRHADVTVLADIEVDADSSPLLSLAADAENLVVVEERPFEVRNHLGAQCARRYRSLRRQAVVVPNDGIDSGVANALARTSDSARLTFDRGV